MSSSTSNPSISLTEPHPKPLKMMSQQEKLALKAARGQPEGAEKASETPNAASATTKKDDNGSKDKSQFLRPSTPPAQTGAKLRDDSGDSPASQACTDGSVTPSSEGVRRSDRNVRHASPLGFDA